MKVGLALGGGGARCFAHLGVLRALHQHDITPVAIAASSTGAVLSALYAAGHSLDEIIGLGERTRAYQVVKPQLASGFLSQHGLEKLLRERLPETFEELRVSLASRLWISRLESL